MREHFLDISADVCPLTFVKTKLLIEQMKLGETASVRLTSGEPLENLPRSVGELGHSILSVEPEAAGSSFHVMRLRKAPA